MKVIYASKKIECQCNNLKDAKKLFGGDAEMARSLMSKINALKEAEVLKDIILLPPFRFHKLKNKNGRNLEGYFSIDVRSVKQSWRIILEPLNQNEEPYSKPNIDEIATKVRIVKIMEVSKHYE